MISEHKVSDITLNFVNKAIDSQSNIDALETKIVTRCQKLVPIETKIGELESKFSDNDCKTVLHFIMQVFPLRIR